MSSRAPVAMTAAPGLFPGPFRSEGGQMGQPQGVGNEGVDPKGSGEKVSLNVFTGPGGDDRSARSLPRPITLKLRWESALPVRLAELKSHEVESPTLDVDGYCIAVYGVPNANFKGDPKDLGKPLKGLAALKREAKKDVRPVSAEVFRGFPKSLGSPLKLALGTP